LVKGLLTVQRLLCLILALAAAGASFGRADDSKKNFNSPQKAADDDVTVLLNSVNRAGEGTRKPIHEAVGAIERKLNDKATAEAAAKALLDRRNEFQLDPVLEKRLSSMIAENKSVVAAQIMLRCVQSKLTINTLSKGSVVIGRVTTEDGKLDPEWVLAQMPILDGGYFAGEVGSMKKPLRFRAAGYEDLEVPLGGMAVAVYDVGTVTLKPTPPEKMASVKGKVALDLADRGPATVTISLMVPPANTPHGGYSPRRRWPEPTTVKLEKDGSFRATGLTPSEYYLQVHAKVHANVMKRVKLEPGKERDEGTLKLRTTDLAHYIGKPAPNVGELPWEKDYKSAMKRAAEENKPVMVMMTATWCGPCKMLEKETLNNPWVKHFLSGVVIVQAFEDKEVEKKYGLNGYPTLVFVDSTGKEVHRTAGYKQSIPFLAECVKAFNKLSIKLPEELQLLVDKKVVGGR
jgi:thiol-disulfide isomerase/thioredoxin